VARRLIVLLHMQMRTLRLLGSCALRVSRDAAMM